MIVVRMLLLLVLVVAGCDTAGGPDALPDSGPTGSGATEGGAAPTGDPGMENTGPEQPLPTDDAVSVNLPGLPVGGGATGDEQHQCASATTLVELPAGLSIEVTAVRFSVDGVFTANSGGCDGNPDCAGHKFTSGDPTCGVDLTATGTSDEDVVLELDGTCTADDPAACTALENQHGSVSLFTPFGSADTETETTTTG